MLDIAWSEIALIGAVALVAIGPKDLPKAMLTLGKAARHVRRIGNDLRHQFDQLSYEAEIAAQAAEKKPEPPTVADVPPRER